MSAKKLRCAIYTRKSTEEGLEQEFNSLDAQREACAAFIASQVGLGWRLVPDHYDDGGISGGTMERPALQRLLGDIGEGKVDVVVVYKIDRLTRSLMDFARIVDIFDRHEVSFVSVTQQFNTTTSMGRLTLNVLLSFAQFEREVTAERIRDKVAASKKKGMWMGGTVPFGYRVENRKLVIDEPAAAEVRRLFARYLELGSVPALAAELNALADATSLGPTLLHGDTGQGRSKPAGKIGRGKLYYMLSNPIYVGRIRHGGAIYRGEHRPIIEEDVFNAVQERLAAQAPRSRGTTATHDIHLLSGLLFDEAGDRLSPTHATKAGKRYRYYVSARLKSGGSDTKDGWRIPAAEIEAIVLHQLENLLVNRPLLSEWLQAAGQVPRIEVALEKAGRTSAALKATATNPEKARQIVRMAMRRISLSSDRIRILIDRRAVANWLADTAPEDATAPGGAKASKSSSRMRPGKRGTVEGDGDFHRIDLPLSIRKRGVERRLVIEGQTASRSRPDKPLIDMIARAHAYLAALTDGQGLGRKAVAEQFGVHAEDVSRFLPLAFLSPRIVERILTGRQPADLSVRHLARGIELPVSWAAQHKLLGI